MDVWYIINNMCDFASVYCMNKCIRTMLAGMLTLPVILLVRKCNRTGRADVDFYAMLMLIPAAFTGMSKLFFLRPVVVIPVLLYRLLKPVYGKLYFGVMTLLLARFLYKNHRLKKYVRSLPLWEDGGELERAVSLVERNGLFGGKISYLKRVQVYVTEERISPFSGGLLYPFVVLPARLKDLPADERRAVLCHELIHLRAGHILWAAAFRLLKIYWWGNPLIYFCEKILLEDMERVCDEHSVRCADVSGRTYGRALLDMILLMQETGVEGTLCFSDKKDFQRMKRRIGSLAASGSARCAPGCCRKRGILFAALFAGMLLFIAATSYPKYTVLDDIVLYDEEINLLDDNSEELREAVQVRDGRLVIEEEKFGELLEKIGVEGDYVYVSFGTIMKVPGSGGCGNAGMVSVTDSSDIFYVAATGLEGAIQTFWLKYLV